MKVNGFDQLPVVKDQNGDQQGKVLLGMVTVTEIMAKVSAGVATLDDALIRHLSIGKSGNGKFCLLTTTYSPKSTASITGITIMRSAEDSMPLSPIGPPGGQGKEKAPQSALQNHASAGYGPVR